MQYAKSTVRTRFASDSDEDLLFYMSLQSEDRGAAEEAWEEFVARHGRYLVGVCQRFRSSLGDGVEDLAQDVLIRVFNKAHTFRPLGGTDANRARARIRAWLGQIANRLFLTALRGQPKISPLDDTVMVLAETRVEQDQSDNSNDKRRQLLREGLGTLTEREREVLIASYGQQMTSEEVKALAKRFNTTPVNLRQIRCRAFDKLEQYVAERAGGIHPQ